MSVAELRLLLARYPDTMQVNIETDEGFEPLASAYTVKVGKALDGRELDALILTHLEET